MEHQGDKIKSIILSIILFLIIILLVIFFIVRIGTGEVNNFRIACNSFGGEYQTIGDEEGEGFIECSVKYPNCNNFCILNGNTYEYDRKYFNLGFGWNKYFCVEDCRYENSLNNGVTCVC